ncbi:MAG: CaiB/BaiF CoA transferase family protein [Lautropia sp.]
MSTPSAGPRSGLPAALGPLDGVRVIDLTSTLLGPVATRMLGDLGADVIKVESPDGDSMRQLGPARHDGMAAMFLGVNRNKRSVVLNLKDPEDSAALHRLVDTADVLVHNMRPNAAERLGIGYAQLAPARPRLIYAAASGYRHDGPNRDRPAFDELIQSVSGVAGLFIRSGDGARYAPFVIADKVTGYVLASAILAALYERERSGLGQEVQVPMFETMVDFNLIEHLWGHAFVPPLGAAGYPRILLLERRPFQTTDGHVCVTATTDAQWARLFHAIDRPDLAADPRFARMAQRTFHFDEVFRCLAEAMRKRSTAEWLAIFEASDLPSGPANRLEDLFESAYLRETGFFQTYSHPSEGELMTTKPPVAFSRTPALLRRPPPRLGEHSDEVLGRAGPAQGRPATRPGSDNE